MGCLFICQAGLAWCRQGPGSDTPGDSPPWSDRRAPALRQEDDPHQRNSEIKLMNI